MSPAPPLLDIHTPSSSFTIVHSTTQDSLDTLYHKLQKKVQSTYHRNHVGPGWLKYEFNGTVWNLDDESDYTIFVWRQNQQNPPENDPLETTASDASVHETKPQTTPTLHLHDPAQPLPKAPEYMNHSYYAFNQPVRPPPGRSSPSQRSASTQRKSKKSKSKRGDSIYPADEDPSIPKHKREFTKFHSENGVRTVMGSIGPVKNVRMLLKSGYRHVYISRKFALEHGFIPADAAPGHYGYGGLVNLGTWPVTLTPSITQPEDPNEGPNASNNLVIPRQKAKNSKPKATLITVYLSEEPHFDVVLGRSFFEKRQIRTTAIDMTDVVCLDTGEKIECELVILKDGKGEIVTVT